MNYGIENFLETSKEVILLILKWDLDSKKYCYTTNSNFDILEEGIAPHINDKFQFNSRQCYRTAEESWCGGRRLATVLFRGIPY